MRKVPKNMGMEQAERLYENMLTKERLKNKKINEAKNRDNQRGLQKPTLYS